MNKQRIIIWGVVVFLLGGVSGWFVGQYALNTQLSESQAASYHCQGIGGGGGPHGICNGLSELDCGVIATCEWVYSFPSPGRINIKQLPQASKAY